MIVFSVVLLAFAISAAVSVGFGFWTHSVQEAHINPDLFDRRNSRSHQ